MIAPVTAFYAALFALWYTLLSGKVIRQRRRAAIGLMDGGDARLAAAIRTHGNMAEYAPIFLILFYLTEVNRALSIWALHATALAFFLGRVLHAYGLLVAERKSGLPGYRFRVAAMLLTLTVIPSLALALLLSLL